MALTMEDLASAEVGKVISTTDAQIWRKVRDGWWADEKETEIRERHFVGLAAEGKLHYISDMPLQPGQIAVDGEWSYLLLEQDGENWHVACVSNRNRVPVIAKSTTLWLTPRRDEDAKIKGKDNVAAMAKMVMEERAKVGGLEGEIETLTTIAEALTAEVEEAASVKESLRNWLAVPEAAAPEAEVAVSPKQEDMPF